ncbi:MAG: hypothetical protein WAQ17_08180 [Limnochordia bacterium]
MKRLTLITIVLICCASCSAEQPILDFTCGPFNGPYLFTQRFDLWVESPANWQLFLLPAAGVTLAAPHWRGTGSGHESRVMEFEVNAGMLGAGQHRMELAVTLEGAQGVLGLPVKDHYWVLPLNNPQVTLITAGGEELELAGEGWTRLDECPTGIMWARDTRPGGLLARASSIAQYSAGSTMRWLTRPFKLEAGERREVALLFTGPMSAGELHFIVDGDIDISDAWYLNGEPITVRRMNTNGKAVIHLPSLGPGEHELRGFVQALLPSKAKTAHLRAHLLEQEAVLAIPVERDWFDLSHHHLLSLSAVDSLQDQPILLPDGTINRVGDATTFVFERGGLAPLIPLSDPSAPVWAGLPLEKRWLGWESSAKSSSFFLPVLVWDGELDWRIVGKHNDWMVDWSEQRRQVVGSVGSLKFKAGDGRLSLLRRTNYYWDDLGFRWWAGYRGTGAAWRSGSWRGSVEIPRTGSLPFYSLQYSGGSWRARFSRDQAALSFFGECLTWGLDFKGQTVWLQAQDGLWRFDLGRDGLKLRAGDETGVLSLTVDPQRDWTLRLAGENLEVYVQRSDSLGFRLRLPVWSDKRQALTTFAVQARRGYPLFELTHTEGYWLFERTAAYLRASIRGAGAEDRFNYGAGLIYSPTPSLMGNLDWERELGWSVRVGIALPLFTH